MLCLYTVCIERLLDFFVSVPYSIYDSENSASIFDFLLPMEMKSGELEELKQTEKTHSQQN